MTGPKRGSRAQQAPTTRVTPATQPGQPPAGMDCTGLVGEVARKLQDPEPWDHDDGHGATVSVRHAEVFRYADGAAVLRIAEGGRERYAAALITPAAALDLARSVYRVCGLPEPILLERPEHPQPITDEWNVYLDENGRVRLFSRDDWPLGPETAREVAARLAMAADAEDAADAAEAVPEPDPAEVEALAEVIAGARATTGYLLARAVLAAGYERRRP